MVDPAALRKALDRDLGAETWRELLETAGVLATAAREFLRLMETAETVWWCQEHQSTGSNDCCEWSLGASFRDGRCRMVEAVLTRRDFEPKTELDQNQMGIW